MSIVTPARAVTPDQEEDLLLALEEELTNTLHRQKEVARHNRKAHHTRRALRQEREQQRVMMAA
jgi:hypothetical protein